MPNDIPQETRLKGNSENIYTDSIMIDYDLSEDSHVSVKICDISGRVVVTLVDEFQTAGSRSVQFRINTIPKGTYFSRMEVPGYSAQKLLLLK